MLSILSGVAGFVLGQLAAGADRQVDEGFDSDLCRGLPLPHHKHMKSTNMLERLNQELKRRTHVVRIFPNAESCLRLVRALAVEMHENWLEATRYLNMDYLKEHKKRPYGPWPPDGGRGVRRCAIRGLRAAHPNITRCLFAELDARNWQLSA
jgi:Transposase, Mutator family